MELNIDAYTYEYILNALLLFVAASKGMGRANI